MLRQIGRVANYDFNLQSASAEAYQTVHKFEVKFDKVCRILLSFYDDLADFEKDEEKNLSYIYIWDSPTLLILWETKQPSP
jgi:hypothetical protein